MRIPAGDNRLRAVCGACGAIHYENPRIVAGCVPEWQGRILLCQRAIMPRRGFWTVPAGFYELGETLQEAAARESLEEALVRVAIGSPLAITHVLHAGQVHMTFRARMLDERFGVGSETLQVGLYEEHAIPWDQIAFPSIEFALRCYFEDRRAARESLHFSTVDRPLDRAGHEPTA
jgi:ADP-ribose pyrophosphatase YjhB (NUDIX family)